MNLAYASSNLESYLAWNLTTCSALVSEGLGDGEASSAIEVPEPPNKIAAEKSTTNDFFLMPKGYLERNS